MTKTIFIISFLSTIFISCQTLYFEKIGVAEYDLNTKLEEIASKRKLILKPKAFAQDAYDTYVYNDKLKFKNNVYDIEYVFNYINNRLVEYRFNIKGSPELYYEIVTEISKSNHFEIDTKKIKYRYYLKNENGNVFLHYKPILNPNNGIISGGKELD